MRNNRTSVVIVLLAGVLITGAIFSWARREAIREYDQKFHVDAAMRSDLIAEYIKEQLQDLDGLRRFIEGSGALNRESFKAYSKPMLDRKGVQAVEWIPVVSSARRLPFEANARREGLTHYLICEKSSDGALIPAKQREQYYPVYYLEPLNGNEKAIGFDLGSNPQRLEAILAAERSSRPQATSPVTLVQEKGKQVGFLIFLPVRTASEPLRGFVLEVFRSGDLLKNAIKGTTFLSLDTTLKDLSSAPGKQFLAKWSGGRQPSPLRSFRLDALLFPQLVAKRPLEFAGRTWEISVSATPQYRSESASLSFLAILPCGLLLTLLLALYLDRLSSRRDRAESLVKERTAHLDEANAALQHYLATVEQAREDLREKSRILEEEMVERIKIQGALERLNSTFSLAADSARIGVWDWHIQEKSLYWDKWMYALYDVAEHCVEPFLAWREGVHPDDKMLCDEAIELALLGRKELNLEFRIVWSNGEVRHVKGTALVLRDGAGAPVRMIGVNYDITDRKIAESGAIEASERLQLLLDSTGEAIYGIDLDGKCTFYNSAFLEMTGYECPEQVIGVNMHDLIHHSHADGSEFDVNHCRIFQAFQQGIGTHVDDEVLWRRDGTSFSSEYWSYPIFQNGNILGAVVTFVDITERKVTEGLLREKELLLQSIVDNLPTGVWCLNAEGTITFGNPAGQRIWAGTSGAAATPGTNDNGKLLRAHELAAARAVTQGEASYNVPMEIECCDGTRKIILNSSLPLRGDNSEIVGAIIISEDITERTHAENANAQLESQLAQAQKLESVGRLAGGVAHDFNNMLCVVIGHAELGLSGLDPHDPMHATLTEIRKAAERSADLTRRLLAFARKQTVAPKVINLNEAVGGILKMLQRLIGEDIKIKWRPAHDLWLVKVDPSQFDQMLANLCVNSRDAIENNGQIVIATKNCTIDADYCSGNTEATPGDYVRLTVSDNGSGMSLDTLAHVFEPFYTTKEVGAGTGLGLATVYGAVKQNDGFIEISSQPGQGTAISVHLPRNHGSHIPMPGDGISPLPETLHRETILLVEDEPAILEITSLVLSNRGYQVLKAGTPGAALQLSKEHAGSIHLLLTDVIMPEMNGRELTNELLEARPYLKHLFMSGYTSDVIAQRGILEEGVNFIQKPFSNSDLTSKVRELLDSQ